MENFLRGSKKWGVLTPKIPLASAPLNAAHETMNTINCILYSDDQIDVVL